MSKKIPLITIYSIIFLGLLFLFGHRLFPLFSRIGTQVSSFIVYPALLAHQQVIAPIKEWYCERNTMQELKQGLKKILEERDALLAENISLRATTDYFQDIAELIDFNTRYETANAQIAQILVRHLSDQAHFFLVDAGGRQGVKVNMVAIYKNCLLGKVIEVYPWYSKVELITDAHCKIAGYCGETNVHGIYEGINNETCTNLSYVSHLNQVKEGDMIISSGEGLIFPRGFGLGRVLSISTDGLYHIISAKPLIDLRRINYCTIIAKGT